MKKKENVGTNEITVIRKEVLFTSESLLFADHEGPLSADQTFQVICDSYLKRPVFANIFDPYQNE